MEWKERRQKPSLVRSVIGIQSEIQNADVEIARDDALKELEEANEKLDRVEQELFDLRARVTAGEHVLPKTRVLSLRDHSAQRYADERREAV
jgi:cob(I)alamin adenosyltransferase